MTSIPITITLACASSGMSENLPVQTMTLVSELVEWASALFDLSGDVRVFKDGRVLQPHLSLAACGVRDGDLLAVQSVSSSTTPAPSPAAGLDFSNLLAPLGGSTSSSSSSSEPRGTTGVSSQAPEPVYFQGMSLTDAMGYNPHPQTFIKLLQSKDHLFKELNYHNPRLASRLRGQSFDKAVQIWREEIVKGGIKQAMNATNQYHAEQAMAQRLQENPNDEEAKQYFAKKNGEQLIHQQYQQMMEEYPESLGRVLMLYIEAKINGHPIQAFCDSGAQATIMSKRVAEQCGLLDYIDTRFAGTAVGVGTGKILGRIHIVQLQIGDYHFPCSVTVMDDPQKGASEMPFLLGLDMMKRHTCQIDLEKGVLKFRLAPGQFFETPFLHEKDLDESKGGTKGFDANKANKELMELEKPDED